MPSDTAFLNYTAPGFIVPEYDRLGSTMGELGRSPEILPQLHPPMSPRFLSLMVLNLSALGIEVGEGNRVLRGLSTMLIINHSLYMFYTAARAIARARTMKEMGMAAAETTALAVAQQWHKIAMGFAAAGIAAASFAVGEKFGSDEWNLPSVNMSAPTDRRAATRKIEGYTTSSR